MRLGPKARKTTICPRWPASGMTTTMTSQPARWTTYRIILSRAVAPTSHWSLEPEWSRASYYALDQEYFDFAVLFLPSSNEFGCLEKPPLWLAFTF